MYRFRRLSCLLVLTSYLLAGGWGPGSSWMRCEAADGTVQIETRFTSCCDEDRDRHMAAVPVGPRPDSLLAAHDGSVPCVDTPLLGELAQVLKDRRVKDVFSAPLPLAVVMCDVTLSCRTSHASFFTSLASPWGRSAHASVSTVVLRC